MMKMKLSGSAKIYANLDDFTQQVRDKMLKKAAAATMAPMERAAKSRVRVDLGSTKDAIQTKISTKGSKGQTVLAYMGLRKGIKILVRVIKRGPNKGKPLVAIPSRYGHLIENGHVVKDKHGKIIGRVTPHPYMRPAWDEYGGENAIYTFEESMTAQIAGMVLKNAISSTSGS